MLLLALYKVAKIIVMLHTHLQVILTVESCPHLVALPNLHHEKTKTVIRTKTLVVTTTPEAFS